MGERRSGLRSAGRAERASTAPPTGSTAAPEKATTPFWPVSMPGVERPWTVRIPAITAKAVPSRTVRPSRRRAPTIERASAAIATASEAKARSQKWTQLSTVTSLRPKKCRMVSGREALAATRIAKGTRRPRNIRSTRPVSAHFDVS